MKASAEWKKMEFNGTPPLACFGHTVTSIGKTRVVLFGGAVEIDHKLTMTDSLFVYNLCKSEWSKIVSPFCYN